MADILHSLAWLLVAPLLAFCGGYVAIRALSFLAAVARKRLFTATGAALFALALGLLPTIAKRNTGESTGVSLPREEPPVGEAALSPLQETFRIEALVGGDSGSPCFLLLGNQRVLIYAVQGHQPSNFYASAGYHTMRFGAEIQEIMDNLSSAGGFPLYILQSVELSGYLSLEN